MVATDNRSRLLDRRHRNGASPWMAVPASSLVRSTGLVSLTASGLDVSGPWTAVCAVHAPAVHVACLQAYAQDKQPGAFRDA